MRMISKISAAFLLLDGCGKQPILGASILADGKRVKYIAKGDGHYVFMDLPERETVYTITVPGYRTETVTISEPPFHLPVVVLLHMELGNPELAAESYHRLLLTESGKPATDHPFALILETIIPSLRVIETAKKGGQYLKLGGWQKGFCYHPLLYGKEQILLTGFRQDEGLGILKTPLKQTVKEGSLLKPLWELQTDHNGEAALRIPGCFRQKDEWKFTVTFGGHSKSVTLEQPESKSVLIAF